MPVLKSGAAALAAATLVLTAAGTAHAGSAHADTAKVDDRTGDVWRTPAGENGEWRRADSPLNADLVKTVVDHRERMVVVKRTCKRLAKKDNYFPELRPVPHRRRRRVPRRHLRQSRPVVGRAPLRLRQRFGVPPIPGQRGTECTNMTHNYRGFTRLLSAG